MSPQGTPRGRTPDAASAEAASIADRTLLIQTVAFVGSVVPVFFVFLRILGRRMRELRLGPDDYLILAALIPQCFYLAFMSSYSTRYGYGVHIWDAPPLAMLALAQTVFVAEIGYALVFTLTKLSMFAIFYRTIGSRPHALPFIQVLICLVLVSITVLQCVPPRAWAFGVSTVKLYFIRSMDSKGDDPTYNLVPLGVWMMADTGFSLICANWPFFIPALDKL
ncbi:hypothetical protein ESCO_001594 [Escovopsis weberi]|uniref:Rhodopsin domain-containing protein n=1 Tax=Escovopsis weberi TaxID=150374 RepID=A0A0M9VWQ5_ESCWE|nr:hypothetical protein ESCO_001594 [Escovopsis weberi]